MENDMAKNRGYRIIHEPYLTEWLVRTYPLGTWTQNVRVGPVSEDLIKGIIDPRLRRVAEVTVASVDAMVRLADRTILIEAMIRDEPGKIQMLKLYKRLFLTDPKFRDRWELPVELALITPIYNPLLQALCQEEGVNYIHYRPPWIETYMSTLPARIQGPRLGGVAR